MKKNVEFNNEHLLFISRKKTNFFKTYKFIKILRINYNNNENPYVFNNCI